MYYVQVTRSGPATLQNATYITIRPDGRENLVQTARSQRTKNEGEGKFEDETQAVGVEKRKTGVISRDRHSKCSNKLMAVTRELVAKSQDRQAGGVGGEQQ